MLEACHDKLLDVSGTTPTAHDALIKLVQLTVIAGGIALLDTSERLPA